MKLGQCEVTHFGSYRRLQFDFQDPGLTLVQGPTGSGKSTLPDIPAWILYGITSKEGLSDDVRSWTANGAPTKGVLTVQLPDGEIRVTRIRGKSSENDLYWQEDGIAGFQRGKDVTETQRLLSDRLGVDSATFVTASYFSEFSPSSRFFLANAKDRRALFERIAPLEFPKSVNEKATEAKKVANKALAAAQLTFTATTAKAETLAQSKDAAQADSRQWNETHAKKLSALEVQSTSFEAHKTSAIAANQTRYDAFEARREMESYKFHESVLELSALIKPEEAFAEAEAKIRAQHTCGECEGLKGSAEALLAKVHKAQQRDADYRNRLLMTKMRYDQTRSEENPHKSALEASRTMENTFTEALAQAKATENPYAKQVRRLAVDVKDALGDKVLAQAKVAMLKQEVGDLETLQDLCAAVRSTLLSQSVSNIQHRTNTILETYFDAPLRVEFEAGEGDSMTVTIFKNGHTASYSQLSKGQRQLLKLSFAVSVMDASANKAGVHFSNLFFDEALDGLDTDLKLKSYSLFLELSKTHENIIVIDHSEELKQMFDRRYTVRLEGDESEIERTGD